MARAVLEARDALESAGHQVCIVWIELSLRQETPLSQLVIRCVSYGESCP